ncbi:DUF7151 family protein [Corallococcus terminator]
MRWTWAVPLLLLGGCDAIRIDDFLEPHATLTRRAPVPPGEHCAHGGEALLAGSDENDDGQLSDDEADSIEYFCATALPRAAQRTREEPASVRCEHGGRAVETGIDADLDGVLDDTEEVTATEYVCATAFPGVLVRTRSVAPSEACPKGGQVTHAGSDSNGNGVLEDTEISREAYGCNEPAPVLSRVELLGIRAEDDCGNQAVYAVESGADLNANGVLDDGEVRAVSRFCDPDAPILWRHQVELPGVNCLSGGITVASGGDTDQDNELQGAEVLGTSLLCQPAATYEGIYELRDDSDIAALQAISRIRGGLIISSPELREVVLPGLEFVEGTLKVVANPKLNRVELPALRYVRDDLTFSDNAILAIAKVGSSTQPPSFPVRVEGSLTVDKSPLLTSLVGLTSVAPRWSLKLTSNALLREQVTFHFVDSLAGDLHIQDNGSLGNLSFSRLVHVSGSLEIINNPALSSLGVGKLQTVGHDVIIESNRSVMNMMGMAELVSVGRGFSVMNNNGLTSLTLPALVSTGGLFIDGNAELASLGPLPSLDAVDGDFNIVSNSALRRIMGLERLRALQGGLFISSNAQLNDLSAFATMESLSHLHVEENRVLASLNGLHNIRSMASLTLRKNPLLAELKLDSLEVVRGSFSINSNPKLPNCHAVALAEAVHTGPLEERFVGHNDEASPLCPPP